MKDIFENVGDGRIFEEVTEYVQWIMKGEMVFGYKVMNAFKVFERVVQDRLISKSINGEVWRNCNMIP